MWAEIEVNQSGLAQALGVNAVHEVLVLDARQAVEAVIFGLMF